MAKTNGDRNRFVQKVKDGDFVTIEDSAHGAPTKVYLAGGSSWLTPEEARNVGMELIYRAGSMYKPGEDE